MHPLEENYPKQPARIVVADDDEAMRRLIVDAFRRDGHVVESASCGEDLLARLDSDAGPEPDLIFTDLRMPRRSGLEVVHALRVFDRTTPVIIMTAFPDDSIRAGAIEEDAVLFDKPFDVDDLRTAVLHLLRHHGDLPRVAHAYFELDSVP